MAYKTRFTVEPGPFITDIVYCHLNARYGERDALSRM